MAEDANKTRITTVGGNPTKYGNHSARIRTTLNNGLILTPAGGTGTAHILYDDGRLATYDNSGDEVPVAEEYVDYWRKAFNEAQKNAQPNLLQKGVHWVGDKLTQVGGWLNRFEYGGVATQQPSQEQVMKELMAIVQQAATELQSNKPGQGVQTLAQIANDPQGSQLLDDLVQQVPEAGQIVEAVMKMIGAFKCGGKTKKKVKKGAKGCVPCKKLMRIGGKLINVWSDCEGNIIKHANGGYLIPKADKGWLTTFQNDVLDKSHNMQWLKNQQAFTETKQAVGGTKYAKDSDGKVYAYTAVSDGLGGFYWQKGNEIAKTKQKYMVDDQVITPVNDFASLGDAYTTIKQAAGPQQFYDEQTGTWSQAKAIQDGNNNWIWVKDDSFDNSNYNWVGDDDLKTGITKDMFNGKTRLTREQTEAAGINADDYYQTIGKRGTYEARYNPLFEDKPSELQVTQGYIDHNGGLNKTIRAERKLKRDLMGSVRQSVRAQYQNYKTSIKDTDESNDIAFTSKRDLRRGLKDKVRQNLANQASRLAAAISDKWANFDVGTPASSSSSGNNTSQKIHADVLKQGGWLNKFN